MRAANASERQVYDMNPLTSACPPHAGSKEAWEAEQAWAPPASGAACAPPAASPPGAASWAGARKGYKEHTPLIKG